MTDDVILISGIACFSLTLLGLLLTVLEFRRAQAPVPQNRPSTATYSVRPGQRQSAV